MVGSTRRRLGTSVDRHYRGSTAETGLTRLRSLHFVTAITLFGSAFLLSALPFMILVSSFANRRIEDDLASHLGLDPHAASIVGRLFQTPAVPSTGAVLTAVLFTTLGTVGLAGSVRTLYEQIFDTGHRGRGLGRLVLWVVALCCWLALDSLVGSATRRLPGGVVADGLGVLVISTLFFWWSTHLLLAGQVFWRRLFRPAGLTAVLWLGLQALATLYFSATISNDSRLYGTVGVVFSLLTWFMAVAAVIVLGALAGEVWEERRQAVGRQPQAGRPAGRVAEAAPAEDSGTEPSAPLSTDHRPRPNLSRLPGAGPTHRKPQP